MPSTLRHAPVSGAPPWEPAPQPTSELPWAVVPGPHSAGGRAIGRVGGASALSRPGPPESAWQPRPATASSAPRSIFDPDQPQQAEAGQQAEARQQAGAGQRADSGQLSSDSGSRPIYIWNPADETDLHGQARQQAD